MTDAATIARGLTKASKRAICHDGSGTRGLAERLMAQGLVARFDHAVGDRWWTFTIVTPLGLTVREYLKSEQTS